MRLATRPVLLAVALLVILAGVAWAEEAEPPGRSPGGE